MMSHVWSTGTLVNREVTSKLTSVADGWILVLERMSMKCLELVTWCWVWPTSGCRMLAR